MSGPISEKDLYVNLGHLFVMDCDLSISAVNFPDLVTLEYLVYSILLLLFLLDQFLEGLFLDLVQGGGGFRNDQLKLRNFL